MPTIHIKNLAGKTITYPNERLSMLHAFQEAGQDWMHACGGKGRCTTCGFNVIDGMEDLSEATRVELTFREEGRLGAHQRLGCQTRCKGEVVIEVPGSNQLPHLAYSE